MRHRRNRTCPRNRAAWLLAVLSVFTGPLYAQTAGIVGPIRMVESPHGLMVADYVGRQVAIVDPATMQVMESLPIYTDDTLLERGKPLSIGWLNGRLYVGEERTGRIQVFELVGGKRNDKPSKNPKKQPVWTQVLPSLTVEPVPQPSAIATDEAHGWLFVSSKIDQAVYVFDEAGTLVNTIGDVSSAAPLGKPQGVALDVASQRVFVSDDGFETCTWMGCSQGSLVKVFNYDGLPLGSISGDGSAGLAFSRVQGVTLDDTGRVFIADSYRNEILIFAEGDPNTWAAAGTLGSRGAAPGQLLLPTGVQYESTGTRLFVANTMPGRIEVFDTAGAAQ
jgi:DNA-binding beta-propeller fold protein YncE